MLKIGLMIQPLVLGSTCAQVETIDLENIVSYRATLPSSWANYNWLRSLSPAFYPETIEYYETYRLIFNFSYVI